VGFFNADFEGNAWWFQERGKAKQEVKVTPRFNFPHSYLNLGTQGASERYQTLKDFIEKHRPSAILFYGYYLTEHWTLWWLAQKLEIPMIFVGETFSDTSSFLKRNLKKPLLNRFFSKMDGFISIGGKNKRFYLNHKVKAEKIFEAKYCADHARYLTKEAEREKLRKAWREKNEIDTDTYVFLFVGRLFARKNPQDFIEITKTLYKEIRSRKICGVIVGQGELEEALKAATKSMSYFNFLGFQNPQELKSAYCGADVLIVPSEFETWGLVVNEAFACGLPALVTENTGVAHELVIPDKTGQVFPVGKISRACEILEGWMKEPSQLSQMSKNCSKEIQNYTPENFASVIEKAFRKITGHKDKKRYPLTSGHGQK